MGAAGAAVAADTEDGSASEDRRQVLDVIWWRARTGSPWRDVPERYGPRETAYTVFRRWQIDGTWTRIMVWRPSWTTTASVALAVA